MYGVRVRTPLSQVSGVPVAERWWWRCVMGASADVRLRGEEGTGGFAHRSWGDGKVRSGLT